MDLANPTSDGRAAIGVDRQLEPAISSNPKRQPEKFGLECKSLLRQRVRLICAQYPV